MTIVHHPDASTLMSFTAGSLPEPLALLVASHCSVCARCCADVQHMDHIGAALVANLPSDAVSGAASDLLWRRIEAGGTIPARSPTARLDPPGPRRDATELSDVPAPLRQFVGDKLDDVRWQRLGFGVWHAPVLPHIPKHGDVRLLRVEPGRIMPEHGHGGSELTMILRGAYQDEVGLFKVGDVADLDDEVEHQPAADPETGCICLIASDKQAVFKGFFARLVQPLTGM
jgi:putative transcriptional regulator